MSGVALRQNLERFLTHIESISDTLPMVLVALMSPQRKALRKYDEFVKEKELNSVYSLKRAAFSTLKLKIYRFTRD